MSTQSVIELFDGSAVVLVGEPLPPRAREEFEIWALVPPRGDAENISRADPTTWQQALQAGPLAIAVFQGVLGNAAWDAFPAAGRYLRALLARRARIDDVASASAATLRALTAMGLDAHAAASIVEATRDGEGIWHVRFRLHDGREGNARIAAGGAATHVAISA